MTIDGKSFDGWMIAPAYRASPSPLQRCPKMENIPDLYDKKPTPQGMDLVQAIVWGLEKQGIVLSNERLQKIVEACVGEV